MGIGHCDMWWAAALVVGIIMEQTYCVSQCQDLQRHGTPYCTWGEHEQERGKRPQLEKFKSGYHIILKITIYPKL